MANDTIFYICGSTLAALAVITSFVGLRSEKFPGRFAPLVVVVFLVLIGATTTFAVLNGKDEERRSPRRSTRPAKSSKTRGTAGPGRSQTKRRRREPAGAAPPAGPGGTLQLAASPTALAFDTTELSSEPGKVTIDFNNPAALEHDVAIEKDGKVIATSELIAEGKTSVTADLAPGTYTFLCTVPGHAEAGMEGTLTVKRRISASSVARVRSTRRSLRPPTCRSHRQYPDGMANVTTSPPSGAR